MSASESNISFKCLICFCSFRSELIKNSQEFLIVFDTFCRLLKVNLIKPMHWNFEEDDIPFCDFCCSAVYRLKGLYDQIESLQKQMTNILNRIKHDIKTSGSDTFRTNEVTAFDRVNYFRHLVVGGASCEEEYPIDTEQVIALNIEPGIKVETETQIDEDDGVQLSCLEGINNEPCELEDIAYQGDPLLAVKAEIYSTNDSGGVDVESFPQDYMEGTTDSIFLNSNDFVSSVPESSIRSEEITVTVTDSDPNHICRFCSRTFRRKCLLKLHLSTHLNENKIHCEECNLVFQTRNDLIVHENQLHGNQIPKNTDVVRIPKKSLKNFRESPSDRKKQGVNHESKTDFCELCEKGDVSSQQFSKLHSLTCYKRCHSEQGKMKFKCDYCSKLFQKPSVLIKHRRVHTGEKPYKCEVCSRTFKQYSALSTHRRVHTGEKLFKCDICNRPFGYFVSLTRHKRLHTSDRPYQCEICNKTFESSFSVEKHKSIHSKTFCK